MGDTAVTPEAQSADALARIQALAPKLRGDDITAAVNTIICDAEIPAWKRKYLENSGGLCPFCDGSDPSSGPIQADGPVAWAEVECEGCGASWQDVWALVDITEVTDGSAGPRANSS